MNNPSVTQILARISAGERSAVDELLPVLYEELRSIAERALRSERKSHTLQPTALVNEAYLRLVEVDRCQWTDRNHFLAFAARVIRRILVDHARARASQKRGKDWQRITLASVTDEESPILDLVALDDALETLAQLKPRHATVVELRFFSELTHAEIAGFLGVTERTIKNDWRMARSWLEVQLRGA